MIISFLANIKGGGSGSGYSITTKAVTLDDKTEVLEAPDNVAWDKVSINAVHVYDSGYTSGYTDASAFIPVITGESYTYSEDDDFVKTISAQTGTAFSAVTVDATNKFVSGYKSAAGDVDSYSEKLTVSANGIYNADIQYDVRGYFKKVTVDVPGGGPSYGVVADMTGIGSKIVIGRYQAIRMEIICPDLSAYTGDTLWILDYGNNSLPTGYTSGIYAKFHSGTPINKNYTYITTDSYPGGGGQIKAYRYAGDVENNNKVITVEAKRSKNSEQQDDRNWIYWDAAQSFSSLSGSSNGFYESYDDTIYVFGNKMNGPSTLPHYLKSLIIYDFSEATSTDAYTIVKHIVPRSDGKMWDLVSNQEADIVWEKYDGTYPTTFTIVSEYDI